MQKTCLAALCCLKAAAALADGSEDDRVTLIYQQIHATTQGAAPPDETLQHIVPTDDGGFLIFECFSHEATSCTVTHYIDYPNATAFGIGDPRAPADETLAAMSAIETTGKTGGPVFPLKDGAMITWTEKWKSEAFEADYAMQVNVSCCEPAPPGTAALSDALWLLDFTYENSGKVGRAHGGRLRLLYDDAIDAVVVSRSTGWGKTLSDAHALERRLTELSGSTE